MANPCFESQAREKLKLPPEIVRAFAREIMDGLRKGGTYEEVLGDVSKRSGLQPETVNSLLRRNPQTFALTKQALSDASDLRKIRDAADSFAGDLRNGRQAYEPGKIAKLWDAQRRVVLAGHSPVFPWTHERNWAVQLPTEMGRSRMNAFWKAATRVYQYAGEAGKARYEMDMAGMMNSPRYHFWKSSGLDIEPGKLSSGDILLKGQKPSWQTRNFDALKLARYKAAEDIWKSIDPSLKDPKTGQDLAAMIARDVNYATGSVTAPRAAAANELAKSAAQASALSGRYNLLLSSKLFFAKHMDAWLSPMRYLAKTGRMTEAERAAANVALGRWANTVAAHLGILGINYAVAKALGSKTPNLTDPTKSDFLRMRFGNTVVPFSPMLEALRLPVVATASAVTGKGGGDKLWNALWNAAHPAAHTVYEQVSGKDYRGQPIPSIRNLVKPVKGYKGTTASDLGQYVSTRFTPIAISGALREMYQALRDQNIPGGMATAFIKGAAHGVASGLLGTHMYEEEPKKKKS